MDVVELVGRILFSLIFILSGVGHFAQREQMVGYSKMKGVPAAELMVPLTGLMILAGGVMVAAGIYADLGALILVAFLLPTAYLMHAFWKETDPMQKMVENAMFMKDVALAGAALFFFYVFKEAGSEGLELTLTGSLF